VVAPFVAFMHFTLVALNMDGTIYRVAGSASSLI